jgi:hypothetical protein
MVPLRDSKQGFALKVTSTMKALISLKHGPPGHDKNPHAFCS